MWQPYPVSPMCPTEHCTTGETARARTRVKVVISCSTFSNADHCYTRYRISSLYRSNVIVAEKTSFSGNGLLCRLRMYHYGWLCEELTLISEMYAGAMDVNHRNSAKKIPVPKFCFFDFVGDSVHRGPWVDEAIYGYIRQCLGRAAGQFATIWTALASLKR